MLIAVVGGKLQGTEACYLAGKAGFEVLLVDRKEHVPARGLCDKFVRADVSQGEDLGRLFERVDLLLPALEDSAALAALSAYASRAGVPLAFDPEAYALSASKRRSDRLFADMALAAPRPWPQCGFPLVAKPESGSGSRGVHILEEEAELRSLIGDDMNPEGWVLQEFLSGPSYSIEVVGTPAGYEAFAVTDLCMDPVWDCKRVLAPSELDPGMIAAFERLAVSTAAAVRLKGLMDIEVILHAGELKVLEIDARLPSQTPTAVYWSSGWNLLAIWADMVLSGTRVKKPPSILRRAVVYEHIQVRPGVLEIQGEHIMAESSGLKLHQNFFGADEALTDYDGKRLEWRATLVTSGADREAALAKRMTVLEDIQRRFKLDRLSDPVPRLPGVR